MRLPLARLDLEPNRVLLLELVHDNLWLLNGLPFDVFDELALPRQLIVFINLVLLVLRALRAFLAVGTIERARLHEVLIQLLLVIFANLQRLEHVLGIAELVMLHFLVSSSFQRLRA